MRSEHQNEFLRGYNQFARMNAPIVGGFNAARFVGSVQKEISSFENALNNMPFKNNTVASLKGFMAEEGHTWTFNINAALNQSPVRAVRLGETGAGSVDITVNNGEFNFGLKYYKTGKDSAIQQAKSVFEKYKESGSELSFEEYCKLNGLSTDPNSPLYAGQTRIIPADQLDEAIEYLKWKINSNTTRPEQIARYKDTLENLKTKIEINGIESIELSEADAKKIAQLAKEGNVELAELGISTEQLVQIKHIFKQGLDGGKNAAA